MLCCCAPLTKADEHLGLKASFQGIVVKQKEGRRTLSGGLFHVLTVWQLKPLEGIRVSGAFTAEQHVTPIRFCIISDSKQNTDIFFLTLKKKKKKKKVSAIS